MALTSTIHFVTHPDVMIDPDGLVTAWRLSPVGVRRMGVALERPWCAQIRSVFSSAERKATEGARMLAERHGLEPVIVESLGENDRSATGYLPKTEFETVADAFFAHPDESIRGWERAADAQRRIVDAIEHVIAVAPVDGDIAIVSHGGVGALLLCHLMGVPIDRSQDQPGEGGGNMYAFERTTRRLLSGWRRIDQ